MGLVVSRALPVFMNNHVRFERTTTITIRMNHQSSASQIPSSKSRNAGINTNTITKKNNIIITDLNILSVIIDESFLPFCIFWINTWLAWSLRTFYFNLKINIKYYLEYTIDYLHLFEFLTMARSLHRWEQMEYFQA